MMQTSVAVLVGLALSTPAVAEPLVEGRVRLAAGQSAAAAQVLLFDLTDLQRGPVARATTDAAGHFALASLGGPARPRGFALGQNYPNPFNPSTIIPYQLPTAAQVRLEVFNVLGQRVATLVDEERPAGFHAAAWDATNAAGQAVAAGVYMYRLTAGGEQHTRRMVLIDGQAGVAAGAAPAPPRSTAAVERKYGLAVVGAGLTTYVDADFRVGIAPVDIVVETLASAPRAKVLIGGILGDVNADGQVDLADALAVALYIIDPSITPPNNGDISLGDVNADGQLTTADVLLIAAYSANPSDPSLPTGIGQAVGGGNLVAGALRRLTDDPAYDSSPSFSPDGRHLVFDSGRDGKIYAMELREEGGEISSTDGLDVADYTTWHLPEGVLARLGKGTVEAVAFSPDGQVLAVASSIGIWLYDVATYRELALLAEPVGRVFSVSFSPDGSMLASGEGNDVVLWDVSSGNRLATLEGHSWRVFSVSFSPDGSMLASGSGDSTVILWDVSSGSQLAILQGHTSVVESVSFSPDGSMLASGSRDNTVILWDVWSDSQLTTLEGHRFVVGSVLASGGGLDIVLWDVSSRSQLATLRGSSPASFSPDGSMLASEGWDNDVIFWDVSSRIQLASLQGHTESVESVSFSPDGSLLAAGGGADVVLWNVSSRIQLATLQESTDRVWSVSFSPADSILAFGKVDGKVILWDVSSGSQLAILQGHTSVVESVSFSADGSMLASGGRDGTVILWDVSSRSQLAVLQGHTERVEFMSFSADGSMLASGGWDGTVIFWDVSSGSQLVTLPHTGWVSSVSFSTDDTLLASGSGDGTVLLWQLASIVSRQ